MTKPIGNRRPPKPKERKRVGGNIKPEPLKDSCKKAVKSGKQSTLL